MFPRLRTYFFTGVVVAAPIFVTFYLAWAIIDTVDNLVIRQLLRPYLSEDLIVYTIPGLGMVVMAILLTLFGALTANFLGRNVIKFGERLVDRTPIIRSVYATLKQIVETVMAQNATSFRDVVLVEYPKEDCWALAFVSSPARGELQEKTEKKLLNVLVLTTPNPTSGYLLLIPEEKVIFLEMTVEEAMKYIISAGLVAPGESADTIAARLGTHPKTPDTPPAKDDSA